MQIVVLQVASVIASCKCFTVGNTELSLLFLLVVMYYCCKLG